MKTAQFIYLSIKKNIMSLIKKIHYMFVYFILRRRQIEKRHAQVMAEQYIYFYYNN